MWRAPSFCRGSRCSAGMFSRCTQNTMVGSRTCFLFETAVCRRVAAAVTGETKSSKISVMKRCGKVTYYSPSLPMEAINKASPDNSTLSLLINSLIFPTHPKQLYFLFCVLPKYSMAYTFFILINWFILLYHTKTTLLVERRPKRNTTISFQFSFPLRVPGKSLASDVIGWFLDGLIVQPSPTFVLISACRLVLPLPFA